MGSEIFLNLAISLGLTLALELIFALVFKVRGRDLILIVLVNFLTNPAVVLSHALLSGYTSIAEVYIILALEVTAISIEWLCYKYRAENIRRPLLFSIGANSFSYLSGLIILAII